MKSDFPPLSDFLPEHLKEPKQPNSKKLEKQVEQPDEVSSGRVSKGRRKPVRKNKGRGKKSGGLILSPSDPMTSARKFISYHCTKNGLRTLHYYRGSFYGYAGTHYRESEAQEIRSKLYEFLDQAERIDHKGKLVPFEPTRHKVLDVLDALKAKALVPSDIELPVWLDNSNGFPADEILACKNVLLHLPTRALLGHTPTFFGYESLPFEYDRKAPVPKQWHTFLGQLWPDDPASIETLQEWFGYCLTSDTRQQKMLLIFGPKRSGKGTIGRIQTKLLGRGNVCAPTLFSLTQNFGLQPLVNKTLAIVSDARLGNRTDQSTVAERLLSISGEDVQTIDRKYGTAWTGTLSTRFMILTNELPKIGDASGALPSRFIVLRLTQSFYGQEDTKLTDRLATELSGILNWAIDGWVRLQRRGRFVQPESANAVIGELEDLSSPISEFIRDRCLIGKQFSVPIDELFGAWGKWCELKGVSPGTSATFGKDLHAALPYIKKRRLQTDGKQKSCYEGIKLRD